MLHTNFANSPVTLTMCNFKIADLVKNSYSKIIGVLQALQNRIFASQFVGITLGTRLVFLLHGIAATWPALFSFS